MDPMPAKAVGRQSVCNRSIVTVRSLFATFASQWRVHLQCLRRSFSNSIGTSVDDDLQSVQSVADREPRISNLYQTFPNFSYFDLGFNFELLFIIKIRVVPTRNFRVVLVFLVLPFSLTFTECHSDAIRSAARLAFVRYCLPVCYDIRWPGWNLDVRKIVQTIVLMLCFDLLSLIPYADCFHTSEPINFINYLNKPGTLPTN